MRIAYIARFERIWDEEYIARSFETLGHTVVRLDIEHQSLASLFKYSAGCDLVLFCKFPRAKKPDTNERCIFFIEQLRKRGIKTATWVFDIYMDSYRNSFIGREAFFRTEYLFTTDGGHQAEYRALGLKHQCVRQGIYAAECYLAQVKDPKGIAFLGEMNIFNKERGEALDYLMQRYGDTFHWYGKDDINEVRSTALNDLFARTKIIVGDSIYSPLYWSNRIVETLGRGGFLIHQETPGLSEEYPHLVTYKRGDYADLSAKIDYYLDPKHEKERLALIKKNYEWVKSRYTCEKKCAELLSLL